MHKVELEMNINHEDIENKTGSRKNVVYMILLFLFFAGFLLFIGISVREFYLSFRAGQMMEELQVETSVQEEISDVVLEPEQEIEIEEVNENVEIPAKELDFKELELVNPDIYAWIYIPDSGIDYPILQHPTIESYYLDRGVDGKKLNMGSIYTDYINKKDFTDKLTVVYGHNMLNGSMFGELHKFEDETFFQDHPYIYVYTEEKTFVYQIFAAYEFSNAHLLYNFDFSTEEHFQNFIDQMYTNTSDKSNFLEDIEVSASDHLLTLSTCITGEKNKRYLIQGVLINE
jgi:sortase B